MLKTILEYKKQVLDAAKQAVSLGSLQATIRNYFTGTVAGRFTSALKAAPVPAIIAEVKKASPSKGLLREDFSPVELALAYAKGGAAALSVITEDKFFLGRPEYLQAVRVAVDLPILRKDFVFDEYQLWEAKAWGADSVLLIVAILEQHQLQRLVRVSLDLGLDPLVEVHTEEELKRALSTPAVLIGINNRDLQTFKTDLSVSCRLAPLVPGDRLVVAESGVRDRQDVERLLACGVRAILVGETLVRSQDVALKLRELSGCRSAAQA